MAIHEITDENFDENYSFKTKEASITIKKPNWISI